MTVYKVSFMEWDGRGAHHVEYYSRPGLAMLAAAAWRTKTHSEARIDLIEVLEEIKP